MIPGIMPRLCFQKYHIGQHEKSVISSFSLEPVILHTSHLPTHTETPGYQRYPPGSSLSLHHKGAPLMCPASASWPPEQVLPET